MMLAKSMHQIARIEFRNSKFPYARGLCPLATPARGLCPLDPRQGASPLEPPSLVNNLGPPPFQRLDPPLLHRTYLMISKKFKGCGMGPWLVLVSPCFRENVVATCKIGSFLCSLDNLLQKNVIVLFFFFFLKSISKWRSFETRAILTYFSHFLVTRKKLQKFLQHISHSHTYTYFAHPIDFFCLTNFEKKYEFIRYGFSLV